MAGKTISEIIERMARATRSDDAADLVNMRMDLIYDQACESPASDLAAIGSTVDSNLGYIAGYLPTEYGQKVLDWLEVEHPVFGRKLDATVDEALAAGMLIGEQYREVQLARERKERLAKKRAEGLDLPDIDTSISSEDAKKLFEALRAKRSGASLAPVTDDDSAFGAVDPQPREVNDTAAKALMAAAVSKRASEAVMKALEEKEALRREMEEQRAANANENPDMGAF